MDRNNKKTKDKIKNISDIRDFESLLSRAMITDEQRKILRMIYVEGKPIDVIADEIGLSERTVSNRHSNALKKIGNMF